MRLNCDVVTRRGRRAIPFNESVELSDQQGERRATIASVREAPIELRPTWLSDAELEITFDCPTDHAAAACAPTPDRHWSVMKDSTWRDVRITYQTAARLQNPASFRGVFTTSSEGQIQLIVPRHRDRLRVENTEAAQASPTIG